MIASTDEVSRSDACEWCLHFSRVYLKTYTNFPLCRTIIWSIWPSSSFLLPWWNQIPLLHPSQSRKCKIFKAVLCALVHMCIGCRAGGECHILHRDVAMVMHSIAYNTHHTDRLQIQPKLMTGNIGIGLRSQFPTAKPIALNVSHIVLIHSLIRQPWHVHWHIHCNQYWYSPVELRQLFFNAANAFRMHSHFTCVGYWGWMGH